MSYKEICASVADMGIISSPRGKQVIECIASKLVFGPTQHYVRHPLLPDNLSYIRREIDWYITADPCDLSIAEAAPIWKEHIQEGRLESNYGFWLRRTLPNAIYALENELDTRRAVAYIGNESSYNPGRIDVPCTNMMQFIIRDEMLNVIVTMRSQDVFYGLRNDLAAFQFFGEAVAAIFGTPLRRLYINIGSLHIYQDKVELLRRLIDSEAPATYGQIDFTPFIDRLRSEWNI